MKPLRLILLCSLFSIVSFAGFAQKQAFDVLNYIQPKGWDKTETTNGIQLSTKNDGKGHYATAVLLRSLATTASANENFYTSWEKLVKGTVSVPGEPTMQAPATEKGWTIVSGQSSYTDGSNKGSVVLITATGNNKMANVVILSNTNKYQKPILDFIKSLDLNETATPQNNTTKPAETSANEDQVVQTNEATGAGSKNIYSITVPPTWSLDESANALTLIKNTNTGKRIIEFMPMIKSSGSLEKDMEHIFFEVFDGWSLHNSPGGLLSENGDHEKGFTSQGLPYYMLSNSIIKTGESNGDVIKGTVLLVQAGTNVAIINSADKILGSETEMALNFLLFTLKIKGIPEQQMNYVKQLTGTWGSNSGSYGNSLSTVTNYTAEGRYYVLTQSAYTAGYDYYYDLIKKKQFKGEGVFSLKGNILQRKNASGAITKYFIRFFSRKYANNEWQNLMGMYSCDYEKDKIETILPFRKI